MSMINFPSTPSDGQIFVANTGIAYVYSSTYTSWLANATNVIVQVANNLVDVLPTVSLDASKGNMFILNTANNSNIGIPTNPSPNQHITIKFHPLAGNSYTLSLNATAFRFGTDITGLTATANQKTDYIGCVYNSANSVWDVVAYTKGF